MLPKAAGRGQHFQAGGHSFSLNGPTLSQPITYIYSWVERGTVRVEWLAQEHNTVSPARVEPGPLAPGTSALTIRPLPRQV